MHGLITQNFEDHANESEKQLAEILDLTKKLNVRLDEEAKLSQEQNQVAHVGKVDPRKRLEKNIDETLKANIVQMLGSMIDTMVF